MKQPTASREPPPLPCRATHAQGVAWCASRPVCRCLHTVDIPGKEQPVAPAPLGEQSIKQSALDGPPPGPKLSGINGRRAGRLGAIPRPPQTRFPPPLSRSPSSPSHIPHPPHNIYSTPRTCRHGHGQHERQHRLHCGPGGSEIGNSRMWRSCILHTIGC